MSVEIITNSKFNMGPDVWDDDCIDSIASGKGFRITEQGKSDVNQEPGYYSIHSPLFGTDYSSDRAFEDRHSCRCGNLIGKNFDGVICPKCKSKVEFVDIDMTITGWIILDDYYIIQSAMYKKLRSYMGKKVFDPIIKFLDHDTRPFSNDNPYIGVGITEFKHNFFEIMEWFRSKNPNRKVPLYVEIMKNSNSVFAHCIPVYSSHLRLFVVKSTEIKYSDEDKLFKQIFTNVQILNRKFELTRRMETNFRKRFNVNEVRDETILYKIQMDLDKLWELSFETVRKKTGVIREQCLGGRINFTARNVIIPDKSLRADEIKLGYTTFLELCKLEIVSILKETQNIPSAEAWNIWASATINFDPMVYKVMEYMVTKRDVYVEINRNPTINYGSIVCVRIVGVTPDTNDHTMSLPLSILTSLNADFDGDVLNIVSLKLTDMANDFYRKMNPRNNLYVDRNDGTYNSDAGPQKDQIIGLWAFLNI